MKLSPKKLLEFCNSVRKAGGADPLKELLPGYARQVNMCLVARNLNFACSVQIAMTDDNDGYGAEAVDEYKVRWGMFSRDPRLKHIARLLKLPYHEAGYEEEKWYSRVMDCPWVELPKDVADSAEAFDLRKYPNKFYIPQTLV